MALDILDKCARLGSSTTAIRQPERTQIMTLQEIYAEFTAGSAGFINAVHTHCGYCISKTEIARIAAQAATAEQFEQFWQNTDAWTDAKHDA